MQERLLDGAPPGCRASCTDNGWINGEVFLQSLHLFVEQLHSNPERNVLLILDSNKVHKYIKALDFAKENNVLFLSFAPRTTHQMQPFRYCSLWSFKLVEFGPRILMFSLMLIMLQFLLQIIQVLNMHQIFGMVIQKQLLSLLLCFVTQIVILLLMFAVRELLKSIYTSPHDIRPPPVAYRTQAYKRTCKENANYLKFLLSPL
ncbi:hypothetical protein PR048_024212 [Dryococelus australis]|uniref:DDE-1 domain-containing protein n=1 Tax=Dryococelus australis TaxID=614101 RepID=A0ABQ9GMY7_9NEOP|nr:hypothetical protein PR048_024212 [Dryococelus australis]